MIHLAAALQYAGWRHVVGTQWSVGDNTAAHIAAVVYDRLTNAGLFDPTGAAFALHRATRQLRNVRPHSPAQWVPFIHIGP